jgi:hypothetical protein
MLMSILGMVLPAGNGALACFMVLTLFEGPLFPTIFAMTLRGLGRHTKLVSTGLTMAISGGAVWPTVSWATRQHHEFNDRWVLRLSIVLYAAMLAIVGMINLHPTARQWVDPDREATAPLEAVQDMPTPTLTGASVWEKGSRVGDASEHIEFVGNRDPRSA